MADATAGLVLGNTAAKFKDKDRYKWVLYVRGATQFVESVTILLHPTFKNPIRTCTEPPFEFASAGWGTFDINVEICWKDKSKSQAVWALQFGSEDAHTTLPIPPQFHAGGAPAVLGKGGESGLGDEAKAPEVEQGQDSLFGFDAFDGVDEEVVQVDGGSASSEAVPIQPEPEPPESPPAAPELLRSASAGSADEEPGRAALCARLRATGSMAHTDSLFKFGRGYDGPVEAPVVKWKSSKAPRKDHACAEWLTATEFEDTTAVSTAKIRQLAMLVRCSRKTVLYTGAGISAAVIGQAALSGQNTVGWKSDTRSAPPTFTHHVLGFLGREGLVHGWVQQNHDGLPQKAGFPQERINEIHGSWFDPSNPVVKYSGNLHSRSYPWMREDARTADLVLVLGTSLGGLNADQVASKTAERSLLAPAPPPGVLAPGAWICGKHPGRGKSRSLYKGLVTKVDDASIQVRFQMQPDMDGSDSDASGEEDDRLGKPVVVKRDDPNAPFELVPTVGGGLGTVCINLQQTPHDGMMTLRCFGKSDDILRALVQELGFSTQVVRPPVWPKMSHALVPYDPDGRRITGTGRRMWLDLRAGQEVRITPGHNIQGAKQPAYMHIGASKPLTIKGETRQPGVGIGKVKQRSEESSSFILEIEGAQMRLGIWWLESAMRGGAEVLPIVNRAPVFEQ